MKIIELTRGKHAIVDDEDYAELSKFKWHALKTRSAWYAARKDQSGKTILMHRLLLGLVHGREGDHRDGDGLNNTRDNLRGCSHAENLRNRRVRSTNKASRFKGVAASNNAKHPWAAFIKTAGRQKYLGCFLSEEEAACAYNTAAITLFGEFAHLNAVER